MNELDQIIEGIAGEESFPERQWPGILNFEPGVNQFLTLALKIANLEAKMMPGVGRHRLIVRHTMQFNSRHAGVKPDPSQRFDHFGNRLFSKSENVNIKRAQPRFLTGRESNRDVLNLW